MANTQADRLAQLEARLNELEGRGGGDAGSDDTSQDGGQDQQAALVQAFLQGALVGNAGAVASQGDEGVAPAFLSIFACGGGGGWSPTNYDSVFWCRSRFMCNPSSISCLC